MSICANMQDSESNPGRTCWSPSIPWCSQWCTRMQGREGVNTNVCISCCGFRPHTSSVPLPGGWRKLKMELCEQPQVGKVINVARCDGELLHQADEAHAENARCHESGTSSVFSFGLFLFIRFQKWVGAHRTLWTCTFLHFSRSFIFAGPGGDMQWCFSQVKGAIDDDVAEGKSSDRLTSIKQVPRSTSSAAASPAKRTVVGFNFAFLKKENPSKMFCDDATATRIKKMWFFFFATRMRCSCNLVMKVQNDWVLNQLWWCVAVQIIMRSCRWDAWLPNVETSVLPLPQILKK